VLVRRASAGDDQAPGGALVSGRRKGLDGERAAIRALRVELAAACLRARVHHVKREHGATRDVDGVIVLATGARAWEVQIRRSEEAARRILGWSRAFVGPGRVLVYRVNRGEWTAVYSHAGHGTWVAPLPLFVQRLARGDVE